MNSTQIGQYKVDRDGDRTYVSVVTPTNCYTSSLQHAEATGRLESHNRMWVPISETMLAKIHEWLKVA